MHDLYNDIKKIIKNILIKFPNDAEIINSTKKIKDLLVELKKEILKIKMISIKKINISNDPPPLYSKKFIEIILLNLDNVIVINTIIQKNIIGLDNIINNINNELFNLHKLI
jgi:hypothetical protein